MKNPILIIAFLLLIFAETFAQILTTILNEVIK